jgi:hypothetical protein
LWRKAVKDKELEALIRKNVAKASAPKAKKRPTYDATLDATRRPSEKTDDHDPAQEETKEFFKAMKRREF